LAIVKDAIIDIIPAIVLIDVLALDGVFDSGLTALLDVFGTANELSDGKHPLRVRTVGVRRHVQMLSACAFRSRASRSIGRPM
jgi:hypothetical protein